MFSLSTLIGLIPKFIQLVKIADDIYNDLVANGRAPDDAKQSAGNALIYAINDAISKEVGINIKLHPMTPDEEEAWFRRMTPAT